MLDVMKKEDSTTVKPVKTQVPLDASFVHLSPPPPRRASYRNHARSSSIHSKNNNNSNNNIHYDETLTSLYEEEEEDYNDSPFFNSGILRTHKYMTSLLKVTEKSIQNFNDNNSKGTGSDETIIRNGAVHDCNDRGGDDLICLCDNDIQR